MLRNRIIHQNELVYIGPSFKVGETYSNPITSNLDKLQSISYDFRHERVDASVIGQSSVIDRPISSSPVVDLNLEYIINSFHNENMLGFNLTPQGLTSVYSLISGLADETDRDNDRKNLYLTTAEEGVDLIGGATGQIESVLCFHDCQVTSYSNSFSVNEIPTANVSLQGLNASYFSSGSDLDIDILNKQTATSAGTVSVDIPMTGDPKLISKEEILTSTNISVVIENESTPTKPAEFAPIKNDKVQSFSMSFDLNRQPITLLNYKMIYDKLITTPIMGSASLELIEHGSESGSFTDIINSEDNYKVTTTIKNKAGIEFLNVVLNDVRIDDVSHSISIGDKKTSSVDLSFPIDPFDKNKSINFSGAY
jgi:hypothetical protein